MKRTGDAQEQAGLVAAPGVGSLRYPGRQANLPEVLVTSVAILATFALASSTTMIALGWLTVTAIFVVAATRYRSEDRPQLALAVILGLCVATPVTRLPEVSVTLLAAFSVAVGVPSIIGMLSCPRPPERLGFGLLVASALAVAVTTAIGGNLQSLFLFIAVVLIPVFGCYLLGSRLGPAGRRRMTLVVIVLALLESALAVAEVLILHGHIGPPAQLDELGNPKALTNELLASSIERAQGTLGHPLALAFLLAVGMGLTLRVTRIPGSVRWATVALLMLGIIASGSRSALVISVVLIVFVPKGKLTWARVTAATLSASLAMLLLISSGFAFGRILDEFAATGSYTHRVGALEAANHLWGSQDAFATFLGNGYGSTARLFDQGVLQTDGLSAVDNQFVLLLAQGGLAALLCFGALCAVGLVRGHWLLRAAMLVVVANSLVFDWVNWPSAATVGFFVFGAALAATVEEEMSSAVNSPTSARSDELTTRTGVSA